MGSVPLGICQPEDAGDLRGLQDLGAVKTWRPEMTQRLGLDLA